MLLVAGACLEQVAAVVWEVCGVEARRPQWVVCYGVSMVVGYGFGLCLDECCVQVVLGRVLSVERWLTEQRIQQCKGCDGVFVLPKIAWVVSVVAVSGAGEGGPAPSE